MKKAFPIGLVIVGLVFVIGGVYALVQGFTAKASVRDQIVAQNIVTPEDATIPNALVQDADTAHSMGLIVGEHALEATGGKTYAELGRFLTPDGGDTSDEAAALKDENGNPVANPMRNVAFQASALQSMLHSTHLAFEVSDLVIGLGALIVVLGIAIAGIGVALGAMAIPALARRFEVEPVAVRPAA